MANGTIPIPQPRTTPFLGNIPNINPNDSLRSFQGMLDEYGEAVQLKVGDKRLVLLGTHELVNEACDENRYRKVPNNVLNEIRHGIHDGLFTAKHDEENWGIAHRVLMQAFGPLAIRDMFDEMHDVSSQLVLKWARQGPEANILATDDFTRLALDTISLCSMGFRFNSFYDKTLHPFVNSMVEFLLECGRRSQRLPIPEFFYNKANRQFEHDIDIMRDTALEVLKERVDDTDSQRKDLLTAMLRGVDPKTGKKMTHDSIVDNLITFLIAGHETTSGTIAYAVHNLIRNPEEYRKVQEEVDTVIGKGPITAQHMSKLPRISAVLRETLRMNSPIPVLSVSPIEDTILGGKYEVKTEDALLCIIPQSHCDPKVFDNPKAFKPDRMLDESFNNLPKNSWKPFGNGMRACIGRPFAWQEMHLAMAMVFQNFNLTLHDPNYVMVNNQTLTTKPKDLYIHAKLRDGLDPTKLEERISRTGGGERAVNGHSARAAAMKADAEDPNAMKMTILYGSNAGTCEAMAQSLVVEAVSHGCKVIKFGPLDDATRDLPRDNLNHPVIIITSSYEGHPPDNAVNFIKWIQNEDAEIKDTSFAVFGCGNSEWAQTFQEIPKLVDGRLQAMGGKRIVEVGAADAVGEDMFTTFETWTDNQLWPALDAMRVNAGGAAKLNNAPSTGLTVHVSENDTSPSRRDVKETRVLRTKTLTAEGEPVKKHIEIELPEGMTYKAGDYLAIMPSNPKASVLRAMRRFSIPWDEIISLEGTSITIPTNVAMYARAILSDFVELGQPVTKKGILQIADATDAEKEAAELKGLAQDENFASEVSAKRVSILDLLEQYPSANLDFGAFLAMLPPMRVRQYSISSSPLVDPTKATITYSVLAEKAKSGHGFYYGVASSFLSGLQAGDPVHVGIRPSNVHFHLPTKPEEEPLVFIAAGTGIAPFRGFIEERAQLAQKQKLAPAILFYGCRKPGKDDLYADELAEWEESGVVAVHKAYSRPAEGEGPKQYVQDVLLEHREELHELWKKNAKIYVCGSRAISNAVDEVAIRVRREAKEKKGEEVSEAAVKEWWDGLRNVRYVADVFD